MLKSGILSALVQGALDVVVHSSKEQQVIPSASFPQLSRVRLPIQSVVRNSPDMKTKPARRGA